MQRRDFLGGAVGAAVVLPVAGWVGCTSDDDSAPATCDPGTDAAGDSDSHGHHLLIPAADLEDPTDRTYTSTGGDHTHEVSISASELQELGDACLITLSSSAGGHPHEWILYVGGIPA